MKASWKKRALAALLAVLVALGFAELGLRIGGRGPIPIARPTLLAYFWMRDARLGFRNRADGDFHDARSGSRIRTGRFGERRGLREPDGSRPVVLFVGDSTTFCGEVDDDETGPSEVAKRLPEIATVNAGVCGYSTVQSLRMAEEWLDRAPARLVVYTYCDNDYIENVAVGKDGRSFVQSPARVPYAAVTSGSVVRIVGVPEDAGPWGEPVGPDGPPSFAERLASVSALGALELRLSRRANLPVWERIYSWAETDRRASLVLEKLLVELRELCARKNVPLLVTRFTTGAAVPFEGRFENTHEKLEAACRAASVRYVDLAPAFTRPADDYRAHFVGGVVDAHWNRLGTSTYGEALAPHVREALRAP